MKRVAIGAHLPTPWLFEPAKPQDDRADYCRLLSFFLNRHSTDRLTWTKFVRENRLERTYLNVERSEGHFVELGSLGTESEVIRNLWVTATSIQG